MKTRFSAERLIDAPAEVVYRCIADYTHHHRPGGFLPPAFSNQEVLSGGVGDGTRIRLNLRLAGRTNTMTANITEPEPGRTLVEDSVGVRTVFTVEPEAGQSRVRFDTLLEARGLEGLMNKLFAARLLQPLYFDELSRLEQYARSQAAPVS
jgi:polyketide cyclase/dehydrase/lipid transport protein